MPTLSGTLPRHHPVVSMSGLSIMQHPSYIGGPSTSLLGHPTLRRQSSHDMDQNLPRILSRNAANVQFYYGWQTPPSVLSPTTVISAGPPHTTSTTLSSSRPQSSTTSTMSTQPLTIATTESALLGSNIGEMNPSTMSGDSGGNRTYCF